MEIRAGIHQKLSKDAERWDRSGIRGKSPKKMPMKLQGSQTLFSRREIRKTAPTRIMPSRILAIVHGCCRCTATPIHEERRTETAIISASVILVYSRKWFKSTLVLIPLFGVHQILTLIVSLLQNNEFGGQMEYIWLYVEVVFNTFQVNRSYESNVRILANRRA